MNINQILTPQVVSLIITGVIIPFAIKALKIGAVLLEHKINNDTFNRYISAAESSVETAVNAVGQTYVDGLKKSNSWTDDTAIEALNQAKTKAVALMGADAQGFIKTNFGSLESWLDDKIQSYVKKIK